MNKKNPIHNIGLKLIALFLATVLWMSVVNIDNPIRVATFRNIPVSVTNPEIVTNKGKTWKVIDDIQTVNVTVKAKRKILSRITSDRIVAVADLSSLQLESLVPVTVTILGFEGQYTAETKPSNLRLSIEDSTKKVFPVTAAFSGTPREGHVISRKMLEANRDKITVRGPESVVSSIDAVVARADVTGISRSGYIPAELIFYDRNGDVVNKSQLSGNVDEGRLFVYVTVFDIKIVPLTVKFTGKPAQGYLPGKIMYEPETVQLCGAASDLKKITKIEIPPEAIDITGASKKMEVTVDIGEYLPEGIYVPDEKTSNVVVTIYFEQEGMRTIEFQVESIKIENLDSDLLASFDTQSDIILEFRGKKDSLKSLDITDAVSVDMRNYNAVGEYEIPVTVDLKQTSEVALTKNPYVKVTVTEKR